MENIEIEIVGDTDPTPTPTEGKEKTTQTNPTTNPTTNESVSMPTPSTNTVDNEVTEPPKKRLKSEVWNHFEIILENNVRRWAKCKYCNRQLAGRPNDGTTHLKDHYKICPRKVHKDIKQHMLVQEQMAKDGNMLSNYAFSAETTRGDLANMIVLHDYPLSIVEHYGFRKYSNGLQPMFKVPCRNTIKNDIMKLYDTKKGGMLRFLEQNEGRIALTSDMWTAGPQKKGYMALTAHYIDANWKLQNRIISFIHVPSPHTADALSQVMMDCFLDWNIDNKLSTLTLDNCSTNDALVDKLLGTLTPSTLILKGRLFHMRCCAHIINLIVQDGFLVIEKAIKNIRDSVSFWSCTPKRSQDFRQVARQLEVECEKELVLDCKTRWNSIYRMLSVAIEYKDVFVRLSKKDKHYVCLPSEEEWAMAFDVCTKLKLFFDTTEEFSGTKYPTSNIFFPLICEMKLEILSWQDDQNDVIRNMASSMLEKFEKYWRVIHDVMSVAIVLDPRYKLMLINYFFPKIYGLDSKVEVMRIRNLCNDLFEEYKKKHDEKKGKRKVQTTTNKSHGGIPSKGTGKSWKLGYESMLGSKDDMFQTTELDHYLEEVVLPDDDGFDILMWWKCNGGKYPILQMIARDVLAIPISTVASESAFSMSGNKVTKQRSRLKAQTVGALMCTQSWLRKEIEGKKDGEPEGFDQTVEYDSDVE